MLNNNSKDGKKKKKKKQNNLRSRGYYNGSDDGYYYSSYWWWWWPYFDFWWCLWVLFIIILTIVTFSALSFSIRDEHWGIDSITNNLISLPENSDVEVREGNDFIFHEKILESGLDTAIEKIDIFDPVLPFLPSGPNFIFGDQDVTYSRLQSGLAIGFRLGSQATFPLLFEPGLQFLIQPFGVHISSPFFSPIGTFVASDERVKKNITNMNIREGLKNVLNLNPKDYYYVDEFYEALGLPRGNGQQEDRPKRRGFISQEVEKVLPNSVRSTAFNLKSGPIDDFKDLRKEDLIVELVASIQFVIYGQVVDYVKDMMPSTTNPFEPFNASANDSIFPVWAEHLRNCITNDNNIEKDIVIKGVCVCRERRSICESHSSIGLCHQINSLHDKCKLVLDVELDKK